ncbi:unnamed protein product [Darwinula stevensoni]|uniref:Uncharacterized protein n=1 Tax=Darwinula stevensoni TaxID=69355 RepID=A0A7R8ZZ77_9CRUS|nr:unnamed protein product [Darwinula stevensoni]CAG0882990.1 unnamed protein product [Darwinula stevensoni]
MFEPNIWIENNFFKRECSQIIPAPKDPSRCSCGWPIANHPLIMCLPNQELLSGQGSPNIEAANIDGKWTHSRHTQRVPTDAYGTIEFQGGAHPSKAKYIRLAHDTRPESVIQLFTQEWDLELPKLLITMHGGKQNFELQPKLRKAFKKGLLKVAKTTGAWIFTAGTDNGATQYVGEALISERSPRLRPGRVVSVGIAPWGAIENRINLIAKNKDVPYHSLAAPKSKLSVLNSRHAFFLLVDNGTTGKYGAEISFRKKLEKYISKLRLLSFQSCSIPVVSVVLEGGPNTIRSVLEYVTDSPPVPVVIVDGSGRAADLLAFAHRHSWNDEEMSLELEEVKSQLLATIQETFCMDTMSSLKLFREIMECVRHKHLITVFSLGDSECPELDHAMLCALLKNEHLLPQDQLALALTWNRVDIARSQLFVYGQEWARGSLEDAMMQALIHDRLDFVKLLLENGVAISRFLTIQRLEELYNVKVGPSNTLHYLIHDVRPGVPSTARYTLLDIGLVINQLMGGAFQSSYCRRKFRHLYLAVMKPAEPVPRNLSMSVLRFGHHSVLHSQRGNLALEVPDVVFEYPFNDLMVWAILTKRHSMALLMWQHGEEGLAKALIASTLYKAMAHEARDDDLEAEVAEELKNFAQEFENLSLELLDFCYRHDSDMTAQLLTYELNNWGKMTSLSLAVSAGHKAFLAHPCAQILLADLWMGGLRMRKNTNLKVILGLLFPPSLLSLEFKTQEELQLQPQTEEEHEDFSSSSSLTSSDSSSRSSLTSSSHHSPIRKHPASEHDFQDLMRNGSKMRLTAMDANGKENGTWTVSTNPIKHVKQSSRPLSTQKKIYEFYAAPITKFWSHSIAYVIFLCFYTYVVLVRMEPQPCWQEWYIIAYLSTLFVEMIREIIFLEPVKLTHKVTIWVNNKWNVCDVVAVLFFWIGMGLRFTPKQMKIGRTIYCVDIIYWYIRILDILSVNKYLGPFVTMIGKMVENMIYFVILLLVVLLSFGVCRQSILFPNEEASWTLLRDVFYQPYFMIYGEVFAGDIDPPCSDEEGDVPCHTGRWITPIVMSVYLLVANILLINLLIAVFNNIFRKVSAVSHQVWMFQRYTVVMEYERIPVLPPPFIFINHVVLLTKYLIQKCKGIDKTYSEGLKLFLDKDELERIHDFEEDCMEEYLQDKTQKAAQSEKDHTRNIHDRIETLNQRMEDLNNTHQQEIVDIKSFTYRVTLLENMMTETLTLLRNLKDDSQPRERTEAPVANHEIQEDIPSVIENPCAKRIESPSLFRGPIRKSSLKQSSTREGLSSGDKQESQKNLMARVLFPPDLCVSVDDVSNNPGEVFVTQLSAPDGTSGPDMATFMEPNSRIMATTSEGAFSSLSIGTSHKSLSQGAPCSAEIACQLKTEYTSITDDIEKRLMYLCLPRPKARHISDSKEVQEAVEFQTEHLRDVEAEVYQLMEPLIERRLRRDSENVDASLQDLCSLKTDSNFGSDDSLADILMMKEVAEVSPESNLMVNESAEVCSELSLFVEKEEYQKRKTPLAAISLSLPSLQFPDKVLKTGIANQSYSMIRMNNLSE